MATKHLIAFHRQLYAFRSHLLRPTCVSLLKDGGFDTGLDLKSDVHNLGAFECLYGDYEPGGFIDFDDLEIFVSNWLDTDCSDCN